MRSVLNISLPEETANEVRREVKRGNFASVSEYFRHVLRERQQYLLARELREELKEFDNGRAKELNSLQDLST
jgi:Arc/MetJ-type ribon-helix-helix transcriptional regulator